MARRSHLTRRMVAHLPPPTLLALLYLGTILLGALALKLPFANRGGVNWEEALFTATSAVTVTGLSVIDVGAELTVFGQGALMAMMQMGGLGLMIFAVLVLSALGIPIGMPHQVVLREDLNQTSLNNLMVLARVILRIALICELAGAAVLALVFVPDLGWFPGLWNALFVSVSAFNNAGFTLFPDSLSAWVADPVINVAVPAMFILGGLGFVVLGDIAEKRRWRVLSLHSKLMLVGTLGLLLWGWVTFAVLEWGNPGTLGGLDGTLARLGASWFQAATPRTAGFNTLEMGELHDSTALVMIALMLVGGGSTSTAGGIKVTSFIVLILATVAFFERQTELRAFGRRIGMNEILKVMALTTISMILVMGALFVVSISHDGDFLDLAFEVASAFGTTGLSRGATAELDGLGRAVIMATMFIGRVGPLSIGFFLARGSTPRVRLPRGQVFLG